MIERRLIDIEDVRWANEVSFRIRFITGCLTPVTLLLFNTFFHTRFPLGPIYAIGLFEAFINQPYAFILRRIKRIERILYLNTMLDVLAITAFIHYAGGIEFPQFIVLYVITFTYATTDMSLDLGLFLATFSSIAYGSLIAFEYFGFIPHRPVIGVGFPGIYQALVVCCAVGLFYLSCFFADLPAAKLKEKDRKLKHKTNQLRRALRNARKRAEQLTSVSLICRDVAVSLDITTVLEKIIEQIASLLQIKTISIMLKEPDGSLVIKAAQGLPAETVRSTVIKMGENVAGWVAAHQEPILVENKEDGPPFTALNRELYHTKSFICCPLVVKEETIGVVNISNKKDRSIFTPYELEIIQALSADIAVAIDNAKLYSGLRKAYINSVETLAVAVDARDHYTQGHLQRVCDGAMAIGRVMHLSKERLENLRVAALLHDVGKIGITDAILLKSEPLSDAEYHKLREHSLVSEKIIKPLGFPPTVSVVIRHHHEWYNGNGYPDGKKGDEVLIDAYILSVADAFDAMTTDRPYRKSIGRQAAIEEIKKGSGGQFHPAVVEAFLVVMEKGGEI